MRVTSALFVSALVRRVQGNGNFATVLRHGADEAGAIHIVWRRRDGTQSLYSPSPDMDRSERCFACRKWAASDADVAETFEREARFDPDFWALEIEGDFSEPPFEIVPD